MGYFSKKDNSLVFTGNGEVVELRPWGKNSFRTRASFFGGIKEGEIALLEAEYTDTNIVIEEKCASIENGNIIASLSVIEDLYCGDTVQIEYKNKKGEVLLRDISRGGALHKRPRQYKTVAGDLYKIKQTFESDAEEKIYGMGQYQHNILNLKGCNLELAHRNSQASIPFYISSKGYGFLNSSFVKKSDFVGI